MKETGTHKENKLQERKMAIVVVGRRGKEDQAGKEEEKCVCLRSLAGLSLPVLSVNSVSINADFYFNL